MNSHKRQQPSMDSNLSVLEKKELLQHKLKAELEDSEWLHKFKQLSDLLTEIKSEIPATIFCDLRWLTDEETLLIHCPNQETKACLESEAAKFSKVCAFAKKFVITYLNTPDFVITCPQKAGLY
jgi:hypothetical protein